MLPTVLRSAILSDRPAHTLHGSMNSTALSLRLGAALFAGAIAATVSAQNTVSLVPSIDNTLYESTTGSVSNGKGSSIFTGLNAIGFIRRALMQFNVAGSVPAGSKILSATLTIEVMQSTVVFPAPGNLHRVLQSWGEGASIAFGGGGGGAASTTNDATWAHRFYPGTFWTNLGGDFAATPSFTMPIPALGVGTSSVSAGANADVQFWLDNPTQNFGWILCMADETLASTARRINSREATFGTKPTLTITYLTPGTAGTWGTGCPVGAGTMGNAFVGAPIGGTTIGIAQSNTPVNSIGAVYFSLDLDPAGAPLPLPGCTVYLPLAQPIIPGNAFLTSAGGTSGTTLLVPSGFPGYLINCQAAVLDNNPLGFVLSNSAVACLL